MADNENKKPVDVIVRRLVRDTGITEAQAAELVFLIGSDWASLIREAKILSKSGRWRP